MSLLPTPTDALPTNALIAPRFLFRFSADVKRSGPLWPVGATANRLPALDESYRLPAFGQLDGERQFADVRMAWGPVGLLWTVEVEGKSQRPWCRESRLDESDGFQVWIDTRAGANVHRASRFCHRFVFLPAGGGRNAEQPVADQLLINRARENARPVRPRELQVRSKVTRKGYQLAAFVPAEALGGYDPAGDPEREPRLGFTFALADRELGLQTFATGPGFPYEEDPNCWAEVALK